MTETAAGAASVGRMPDAEKPLDEQRSAVDDMPNKAEPQEPSPYDANSSEKAEDAAEKKSTGSMRDYFVSAGRDQACCIGLMPHALIANISICGPLRLSLVRDRNRRCCCGWRCSAADDIGLRLINKFV